VSSHDTQSFPLKQSIEGFFQNESMTRYKHSAVEILYLRRDWDSDGDGDGHQRNPGRYTKTKAIALNENLTAPSGEVYKPLQKTSVFKSTVSAEQCVSVSTSSSQIFKHSYSWTDHLADLEGNLVHAEDNDLSHLENRTGLTLNQRFRNEEQCAQWDPYERRSTEESTLQNDQRLFTGDRIIQCTESQKTLNQGSSVHRCVKAWFAENHYECDKCGEGFHPSSNLSIHNGHRLGDSPHKWNECGKAHNQSSRVGDHQRIHEGKNAFSSNKAGTMFCQSSSVNINEIILLGKETNILKECGKCFDCHSTLCQHQRMHTGEKIHICEEGGPTLNDCLSKNEHSQICSGEKPYKCQECGKAFNNHSGLNRHHRIHNSKKPYQCHECGKSFNKHPALIQHHRIHSGDKPYQCQECGKAFCD
ncbi:zinc finger protein 501-like, partial [Mustela nigripes]|uniref:zinc finger protein 501-like n=1 Tax=Mustela nigripes TaxID=77151 RepID=UPI0028157D0F